MMFACMFAYASLLIVGTLAARTLVQRRAQPVPVRARAKR
jgi:hypothetical protein